MKNRSIALRDGSAAKIHDPDWRSVVNVKKFDDSTTEIIRLRRHVTDAVLLLYVMRSSNGKTADAEAWQPIMLGADPKPTIKLVAKECGISDETLAEALGSL